MKIFAEIGCLLIMLVSVAQGQASSSDGAIQIMRNGAQASWQAPIEHFTGPARVTPLFQAVAPARAPARADPDRDGGRRSCAAPGRSRGRNPTRGRGLDSARSETL